MKAVPTESWIRIDPDPSMGRAIIGILVLMMLALWGIYGPDEVFGARWGEFIGWWIAVAILPTIALSLVVVLSLARDRSACRSLRHALLLCVLVELGAVCGLEWGSAVKIWSEHREPVPQSDLELIYYVTGQPCWVPTYSSYFHLAIVHPDEPIRSRDSIMSADVPSQIRWQWEEGPVLEVTRRGKELPSEEFLIRGVSVRIVYEGR